MSRTSLLAVTAACLVITGSTLPAFAIGARGGGGGGGRGGGGGGRVGGGGGNFGGGGGRVGGGGGGNFGGGGGMARPSMPQMNRPSPQISRPSPQISRPSPPIHGGVGSLPGARPGGGSLPDFGNAGRPAIGNGNRPSVGNLPNVGGRPNFAGGNNLPGQTRPGIGGPGMGRPSTGNVGDFLGIDVKPGGPNNVLKPAIPDRPSTRPIDPGFSVRPGIDRPGGNRPVDPGFSVRPGIDRPGIPGVRPGGGAGEQWPGGRPDIGTRPNRPGQGGAGEQWNRPDLGNLRPGRPGGNNIINNRPSWVNIDNNHFNNIHNNWNNIINTKPARPGQGMNNWLDHHPDRWNHWHNWAHGITPGYGVGRPWFNNNWWNNHNFPGCGWHYHYWNHNYPWNYWWNRPVWGGVTTWFPSYGWTQPIYYDYGTGGNVVYEGDTVYMNNQPLCSTTEFAQSAMQLATVPPPATDEEAEAAEWMPLGTFAVSMNPEDRDPAYVIQLAVSKDGIVSGTMYNKDTDKSQAVQGKVDKETQRVAMRIGTSEKIVIETGIYNLTQDEAPILVHHGEKKAEQGLFIRLSQDDKAAGARDF